MSLYQYPTLDPLDRVVFAVDFSDFLDESDSIVSASFVGAATTSSLLGGTSTGALTIGDPVIVGNIASVLISGDGNVLVVPGCVYELSAVVTTSNGWTIKRSGLVTVADR